MSQGGNCHVEVDVQSLGVKLLKAAQKAESCFSLACIYRVPEEFYKLKKSAYTPRLIAIGPLHRNEEDFQTPLRHVKMSYANQLLCRLTEPVEDSEQAWRETLPILQECVAEMKKLMDYTKSCYAEEVELNVEMMVVDVCFILEFLFKITEGPQRADPIFGIGLTTNTVYGDLLLLENQIPFLVLEKLFNLTVRRILGGSSSFTLTDFLDFCLTKKVRPKEVQSRHYHHILHKVHDGYLPPDPTGKNKNYKFMPTATDLVYAGVKFRPGPKDKDQLFKVKFNEPPGPFWWCRSALFEIPILVIDDSTESFFRNLIAFEQTCPGIPQHFTSYAILMDMLVDSANDVEVLKKAGVVRNCLGASEDAKNLFNNLCKEVAVGEFFYADICNRAHYHTRRFWPKHIADVKRQYFASPWKFIAFCLAFCAVGISVTQFLRSFNYK